MISLETVPVGPSSNPPAPPPRSTPRSSAPAFAGILQNFAARIDDGETLVQSASAGRYAEMDAGRLIALQAGIYRYSETIELGAKLVDRASSSVRAVLQAGH